MEKDKYKGVDPDIAKELMVYETTYFRMDQPVPFCGLGVYPATVKDYEIFLDAISCLTLDKNKTLQGIRMSNLDFLVGKLSEKEEGALWSYRLTNLAKVCFKVPSGFRCPNCGKLIPFDSPEAAEAAKAAGEAAKTYATEHPESLTTEEGLSAMREIASPKCPDDGGVLKPTLITKKGEDGKAMLVVDGHEISWRDFNRLRQIILFQNLPDYRDESWVDPALKKDRERKLEMERKNNDLHATVEKKVIALSVSTNYRLDEIWDMPVRKFSMALSTVDALINYQITKLAYMTGLVTPPKGKSLEHWIYEYDKDMYGDDYKTLSAVQADAALAGR